MDGAVIESVRGRPTPALRPYVAWYTGYRQDGVAPGRHRGLPSPYLTMIVTLDDPLDLSVPSDPSQPPAQYRTLVGGLHTSPVIITSPGRQSGIQLAVKPLGVRRLLGLPAGELYQVDTDAADVFGPLAAEMHERVRAEPSWPRRFAVLDELLSRRLGDQPTAGPEVTRAWRALLASGGTAPVPELAQEAGWSSRRLATRFRDEIGLSPKGAARVVRFDRARRMLQRRVAAAGAPELAVLAAVCGYYDQAHLAREFRALAGCAPSRWIAEEFRNIQVAVAAGPPDSEA